VLPAERMPRACDLQHIAVIQPLAVKVCDLKEAVPRLDCRNRPVADIEISLPSGAQDA